MTSDDAGRAIQALRTGAELPPSASGLLADLLESHATVEVGQNPPRGWLIADMAGLDAARCVLGERGTALEDIKRAVAALREGTPFPPESSPVLATLLEKHRAMEWRPDASAAWLSVDRAAQAVARAVIEAMM
ncbi:hypothetical protein [Saccharopolyspora sp. 5N708]|uniref:hypothetical protein n=1 Tax=Saccharopolyspora sp. 5N708 TaxID=3457424 RepID=UPI003FD08C22